MYSAFHLEVPFFSPDFILHSIHLYNVLIILKFHFLGSGFLKRKFFWRHIQIIADSSLKGRLSYINTPLTLALNQITNYGTGGIIFGSFSLADISLTFISNTLNKYLKSLIITFHFTQK